MVDERERVEVRGCGNQVEDARTVIYHPSGTSCRSRRMPGFCLVLLVLLSVFLAVLLAVALIARRGG